MIILKLIALFLFLIIVPALVGACAGSAFAKKASIATMLLSGYLIIWGMVEIVGIPLVLWSKGRNYVAFVLLLSVAMLIMSILGFLRLRRNKSFLNLKKPVLSWEEVLYTILIFLSIAFQLFMAFYYSSLDADDFYFNAQALSAQAYGTMYRIDASTGHPSPVDIRHAMALFPMWEAYLSSVTGVHVAILVHRAIPVILIPMSYYVIYLTGCELFPNKKSKALIFTFLINVWRIFGYVSYFTTETFFLLRTWQGKSVAGNIILPFVILMFLRMYNRNAEIDDPRRFKASLFMLGAAVLASGSSSSLAVMLSTGLAALLAVLFYVRTKNVGQLLSTLITCIPGSVYIIIYILSA